MSMDMSVIVTLHNEGRLAHRTFRALDRSVRLFMSEAKRSEILIVLDRVVDPIMIEIACAWQRRTTCECHILPVDFGCVSRSRNCGVAASKGEFVAVWDGDDLMGSQWLLRAYQASRSAGGSIAHPELFCFFPMDDHVLRLAEISEPAQLLDCNLWGPHVVAARRVFEEVPYVPDTDQYGFEDWLWNCQTVHRGFRHIIVPLTLAAVRRKESTESLCKTIVQAGKTVRPNALFQKVLSTPSSVDDSVGVLERQNLSDHGNEERAQKVDRRGAFARGCIGLCKGVLTSSWLAPVRKRISSEKLWRIREIARLVSLIAFGPKAGPAGPEFTDLLPLWARKDIRELAQVEPQLCKYRPGWSYSYPRTRLHQHITPPMGQLVHTPAARVFFLPWISPGGAELCAINYMHAVQQRVFLITTERSTNKWVNRLPHGAVHIDLGNTDLSHKEKMVLVLRLILESDLDFMHIMNSRAAFDLLIEFPAALRGRRIFATFFSSEVSPGGEEEGWTVSHLPLLLDSFIRVSTDNLRFKAKLELTYGFSEDFVLVHRFPFSPPHFPSRCSGNRTGGLSTEDPFDKRPLRLLFAGRLAREKMPEVAISAVHQLASEGLDVQLDVWGEPDPRHRVEVPASPNIRFRGEYDGIKSLDLQEYDLLIYPSLWDGLPNVLVECLGNGIPALASEVGGVGEIVNEDTGWLVRGSNDTNSFKQALKEIVKDREAIRKKGDNAREFVARRHSWERFQPEVQKFYWDK